MIALVGCSQVGNSSELVGRYEVDHANGVETLELHADGTYLQLELPRHRNTAPDTTTCRQEPQVNLPLNPTTTRNDPGFTNNQR